MRNTRRNKQYTWNGETHCMSEWAEILGMSRGLLKDRITKLGWSLDRAFTTPERSKNANHK